MVVIASAAVLAVLAVLVALAVLAVGWWQLVVGRSWDRASCSQRVVDTASCGFDLQVGGAEAQGLRAGTEDRIPRVVGLGVGIDSEAVRSGRSPDGIVGAELGAAELAALAASAAVD